MPHEPSPDDALRWLHGVRDLSLYVDTADRAIVELAAGRRFNPRAMREQNPGPALRSGLDALEHSLVAVRAMFRALADGLRAAHDQGHPYNTELAGAFGVLLDDLARALCAYGALLRIDSTDSAAGSDAALAEALDTLSETRAVLTELLMVDPAEDRDQWMVGGAILTAVNRVLSELDVEERARRRQRLTAAGPGPWQPAKTLERLRDTPAVGALRGRRRHPRAE